MRAGTRLDVVPRLPLNSVQMPALPLSQFGIPKRTWLLFRLVRTDGNALHGNLRLVIETWC
jgi:hypothetical protein